MTPIILLCGAMHHTQVTYIIRLYDSNYFTPQSRAPDLSYISSGYVTPIFLLRRAGHQT